MRWEQCKHRRWQLIVHNNPQGGISHTTIERRFRGAQLCYLMWRAGQTRRLPVRSRSWHVCAPNFFSTLVFMYRGANFDANRFALFESLKFRRQTVEPMACCLMRASKLYVALAALWASFNRICISRWIAFIRPKRISLSVSWLEYSLACNTIGEPNTWRLLGGTMHCRIYSTSNLGSIRVPQSRLLACSAGLEFDEWRASSQTPLDLRFLLSLEPLWSNETLLRRLLIFVTLIKVLMNWI